MAVLIVLMTLLTSTVLSFISIVGGAIGALPIYLLRGSSQQSIFQLITHETNFQQDLGTNDVEVPIILDGLITKITMKCEVVTAWNDEEFINYFLTEVPTDQFVPRDDNDQVLGANVFGHIGGATEKDAGFHEAEELSPWGFFIDGNNSILENFSVVKNMRREVRANQVLTLKSSAEAVHAAAATAGKLHAHVEIKQVVYAAKLNRMPRSSSPMKFTCGMRVTDADVFAPYKAPCDGYYTNAHIQVFSATAENEIPLYLDIGVASPRGWEARYPDAVGERVIRGNHAANSFTKTIISMRDSDGTALSTSFMHWRNRKVKIKANQTFNFILQSEGASDFSIWFQADFVPRYGAFFQQTWRDTDSFAVSANYASRYVFPIDLRDATLESSFNPTEFTETIGTFTFRRQSRYPQWDMTTPSTFAAGTRSGDAVKLDFGAGTGVESMGLVEVGMHEVSGQYGPSKAVFDLQRIYQLEQIGIDMAEKSATQFSGHHQMFIRGLINRKYFSKDGFIIRGKNVSNQVKVL